MVPARWSLDVAFIGGLGRKSRGLARPEEPQISYLQFLSLSRLGGVVSNNLQVVRILKLHWSSSQPQGFLLHDLLWGLGLSLHPGWLPCPYWLVILVISAVY